MRKSNVALRLQTSLLEEAKRVADQHGPIVPFRPGPAVLGARPDEAASGRRQDPSLTASAH